MSGLTRRDLIASAAMVGGWIALGGDPAWAVARREGRRHADGPYRLPPLPYGYADLEPYIDAQTMKLHHDIHHAGYVRKANAAIAELARIRHEGGAQIKRVRTVTEALSFNLSGHLLHSVFWNNMKPAGGGRPADDSTIGRTIVRDFGSFEAFEANFAAAAAQVQGSGWGILAFEPHAERLIVLQAEKHNNLGVWGVVPLLVIDVWEHAYYLRYQNRRSEYIKAFFNVVNWDDVNQRLERALGS